MQASSSGRCVIVPLSHVEECVANDWVIVPQSGRAEKVRAKVEDWCAQGGGQVVSSRGWHWRDWVRKRVVLSIIL